MDPPPPAGVQSCFFYIFMFSSPAGQRRLSPPGSVSGLVEQDVSRLRVLGDLRGQPVELLYGLSIDFLPREKGDTVQQGSDTSYKVTWTSYKVVEKR